jgi:hypothetical protein
LKSTAKSKVTSYINPVIEKVSDAEEVPHFSNKENIEKKKPESQRN